MASNPKSRKPVPTDLVKCTFYYLDLSVLQQVTSELAGCQATFDSFSGSGISGTVTADSDGWLMVSVPHEAGWTVTVNGVQVETRGAFGDAPHACSRRSGGEQIRDDVCLAWVCARARGECGRALLDLRPGRSGGGVGLAHSWALGGVCTPGAVLW